MLIIIIIIIVYDILYLCELGGHVLGRCYEPWSQPESSFVHNIAQQRNTTK